MTMGNSMAQDGLWLFLLSLEFPNFRCSFRTGLFCHRLMLTRRLAKEFATALLADSLGSLLVNFHLRQKRPVRNRYFSRKVPGSNPSVDT